MRILVIGGTRFMGPEVVRLLSGQGHEVTVFHRGMSEGELAPGVARITGDRRQLTDYTDELRALKPDVVLDMIPMLEQDADQVMHIFTGHAGRVVMISSQDVYRAFGRLIGFEPGEPLPTPITEDSALREKRYPYKQAAPRAVDDPMKWMDDYDKIPVEARFLSEPSLLPGTVLRLPAVYGPRDRQRRLYSWLKRMDDGRPAIFVGEEVADWRWNRGYMENVAAAIALAVTDDRAADRTYNVGEPDSLTTRELIAAIADAGGWRGQIITLPEAELPEHLRSGMSNPHPMVVDTSRIRAELGYAEHIDRAEAIRRTAAWDLANPPAPNPSAFNYEAEDEVLARVNRGR